MIMKECGTVIKVEGDSAYIEFKRNEGCHSCGLCVCGQDNSTMILKAYARPGTKAGDRVHIEVDRRARTNAQLWLLALPMAVFLVTAMVAKVLCKFTDLVSFLLSIAGLALAFLAAWLMDKKTGWSKQPVARILESPDDSSESGCSPP